MSLPSPGSNHTNIRWMIVLMLMGFSFLAHFNRLSISVAVNEQFIGPDRLTAEHMGLVYSAFLLVYTIGMLPGGWLIDRIGPRWMMAAMGMGLGFSAALTGVIGWAGLASPRCSYHLLRSVNLQAPAVFRSIREQRELCR